jgi:hypothetical protein
VRLRIGEPIGPQDNSAWGRLKRMRLRLDAARPHYRFVIEHIRHPDALNTAPIAQQLDG